jgi:hypothetical protein
MDTTAHGRWRTPRSALPASAWRPQTGHTRRPEQATRGRAGNTGHQSGRHDHGKHPWFACGGSWVKGPPGRRCDRRCDRQSGERWGCLTAIGSEPRPESSCLSALAAASCLHESDADDNCWPDEPACTGRTKRGRRVPVRRIRPPTCDKDGGEHQALSEDGNPRASEQGVKHERRCAPEGNLCDGASERFDAQQRVRCLADPENRGGGEDRRDDHYDLDLEHAYSVIELAFGSHEGQPPKSSGQESGGSRVHRALAFGRNCPFPLACRADQAV